MIVRSFRFLALLFVAIGAANLSAAELGSPVLIYSGENPIDVLSNGCAAPFVTDWDGDGVQDLLIGRSDGDSGTLRIYRNVGSNEDPRYDGFESFQVGDDFARVPNT